MNRNRIEIETSLLKKKDIEFLLRNYKTLIERLCISDAITNSTTDPAHLDNGASPLEYAFNCGSAFTLKMILTSYCGVKEKDLDELEKEIQDNIVLPDNIATSDNTVVAPDGDLKNESKEG